MTYSAKHHLGHMSSGDKFLQLCTLKRKRDTPFFLQMIKGANSKKTEWRKTNRKPLSCQREFVAAFLILVLFLRSSRCRLDSISITGPQCTSVHFSKMREKVVVTSKMHCKYFSSWIFIACWLKLNGAFKITCI